jgi:hypothetical protein
MSSTLPDRPHLDHLRRQARDLHRALLAGDLRAKARAAPYQLDAAPKLSAAQLVLAREHGFGSWPQLVQEVQRRNDLALPEEAFVRRVLDLVYGHGWQRPQPVRALELLQSARLAGQVQPLVFSLALGDLKAVQRALAGASAAAPLPPLGAPALAYAAASSLARLDDLRPGLVATVEWLLVQGADPNTRWADPVRPDEQLPVLYGAVSRASCFETTQALLQAGADPNDKESLYHATEQSDRRIIAALVAAGARWRGTNALYRQLDHETLAHLRQVLALGADVHEPGPGGGGPLHHAINRGRSLDFVQLLLAHGADPTLRDAQGRTAADLAARLGDAATAAYLADLGHGTAQTPQDVFLAACAAGDTGVARAHLLKHPDAVRTLDAQALRLLPDQAQRGRLDAVRLMLELGWPVDVRGDWHASALNQAAFRGDAAMVQLLLDHGARWHERNGYGGDAVGSCLHAATNEPHSSGDYAAVLSLLIANGASAPKDTENLPDELRGMLGA